MTCESILSGLQKGPEKRCRAKIVEKSRKTFWHFLTIFDVFCPARKLSKSVEKLFDAFWRFLTFFDVAPFRWPLLQSAEIHSDKKNIFITFDWAEPPKGGWAGQNVPKRKTSRGWPVGNPFSRPSESCFWGGQLREIPAISKGLTKRNRIGRGQNVPRWRGSETDFCGGLLVRFCPPHLFLPPPPPPGVLWFERFVRIASNL